MNHGFYKNLPPVFKQGPTGIQIFQTNILVNLVTDQSEYQLEEKSSVERNFAVGLWVNDPEGTPQKATPTKTITSSAVFNSAYLVIRRDEQDHYRKLYLRDIKRVNDQGEPYYLSIGERINLSESLLYVNNSSAIGNDEVIEFAVDYVKTV